jgi:glycosyltransferase involved in cell wall biosynthesis
MARILYVSGLWSGLADVLYEHSTPRGMPGFIRPLKALIERGHAVELLVLNQLPRELSIGVDWLRPEQLTVVNPGLRWLGMYGAAIGFYGCVQARLQRHEYDFVYGQGTMGALGVLAANRRGLPCAQRLYGISYFRREFTAGGLPRLRRLGVFLRHPLHYMAFSLPKAFLLVTNDGTQADLVYRQIGNSETPLLFWLNGVDIEPAGEQPAQTDEGDGKAVLLYPGRIDRFKRQHLAIEMMARLVEADETGLKLVFAGHDYDGEYRQELDSRIAEQGLGEIVEFIGPITRERLQELYQSCLAVLSFYDVSNLGNVAIEALASGAALISLADGSLSGIVRHGESALLVDDMAGAANAALQLMSDATLREHIRRGAKTAAEEHFVSWDARVKREVAQIEQVIEVGGNSRESSDA